jgi:hypothetical protein
MRYFLILLCSLFILNGCIKEKDETISEIPKELIRTKLDSTIYLDILKHFPNSLNAPKTYPVLFSDTIEKKIVLSEETEVFVTYIAENAGYLNSLGWYSYTPGKEPASSKDLNINMLFPNLSGTDAGGKLDQGDMMQLGKTKFPKGTVIGFFLIVNGWQNGLINYNAQTHYTDHFLNKGGYQQHILFKMDKSNNIILGFEDMDFESSDKDYNDILLIVSDNKDNYETIFFELNQLAIL